MTSSEEIDSVAAGAGNCSARLAASFIIALTLSRAKVGVFALTEQITGGCARAE
jgi:hypothetical protein